MLITGLNYIQKVLKWTPNGLLQVHNLKGQASTQTHTPSCWVHSKQATQKQAASNPAKQNFITAFLLHHWHVAKAHFSLQAPSELYRLPPDSASKLQQLLAGYFILLKLLLFPIQIETNSSISSCLAIQELTSIFRPSLQSKLVPQIQFLAIALIGTKWSAFNRWCCFDKCENNPMFLSNQMFLRST